MSPSTSPSPTTVPIPTQLGTDISYAEAMRLFEYDHSRPLDVREDAVNHEDGAALHAISYVMDNGRRAQAYLVLPDGGGRFGAILWFPGGTSTKGEFRDWALYLARTHGIASLLIDYPELYSIPADDQQAVNNLIFETRELSRLVDWLAGRPEIDPSRLGMYGLSYGAVRATIFAGVQGGRFKIAIVNSGPPRWGNPEMSAFDPITWAPHIAPCAFYLLEGTRDGWYTRADGEAFIAAAKAPKRLVWYDANHGLNQQADDDATGWLADALGSR